MENNKNLPPETLQKEFESNPLKILEIIRDEKDNHISQTENSQNEKNDDNINKDHLETNNISDITKKEMLEEMKNDFSMHFEFNKTEQENNKKENNRKNKNINTIINNINTNNNINFHNNLINNNSNINFNNHSNIIVNHLNIFFNFNNKNEIGEHNLFVNNSNCKYIKKNCNDNNDINKKINLINYNIDKFLKDLKCYKGSILSQSLIDSINDEKDLSIFFNKIIPHICKIMCLDYGNYFFQKLIRKLNIQQKLNIYQIIEPEFLAIATNKCGTHSIQSLIDVIQSQNELLALNKLITQNMLLLFTDDNAYHIMMKIILDFPEEKRNILNLYLVMNVEKIIINVNGAFCINKFIINNKNLKLRKILVDNLQNNIKKIVFNKFSCINLLLILQTFGVLWGNFIIKEIQENFVVLSDNSVSNVFIIKVLEYLYDNNIFVLKLLIWSLLKNIVLINYLISNKNKKKLLELIIEYSDNDQKKYLLILLKNNNCYIEK
jgi:hypothetical protein